MYVVAADDVNLPEGIRIRRGETILAEISRKFKIDQLHGLAHTSGFCLQASLSS